MKYFITAILCLLTVSAASAQITISEQDYLSAISSASNGSTFVTTNVTGLQALVSLSGASQTWNFSNIAWTPGPDSTKSTLLTDPSTAPLSSDFPGATHVIKLTPLPTNFDQATLYDFLKVTSSGAWTLGFSEDSGGSQKVLERFMPAQQEFAFPLTYGTTWSSSSGISSPSLPAGITDSESVTNTVDGYGTLITPAVPAGVNTLRLKKETTSIESFGMFGLRTRAFAFSWVASSFNSAGIAADSNQKPLDASYSTASGSGVEESPNSGDPLSLVLSQNPASNTETNLFYTLQAGSPVHVSMMDALGRSVRVLQSGFANAGKNIISIDPAALARGTYFIRVEAGNTSAVQKLIIQ